VAALDIKMKIGAGFTSRLNFILEGPSMQIIFDIGRQEQIVDFGMRTRVQDVRPVTVVDENFRNFKTVLRRFDHFENDDFLSNDGRDVWRVGRVRKFIFRPFKFADVIVDRARLFNFYVC